MLEIEYTMNESTTIPLTEKQQRTGHFVVSDGLPVDYPVLDTDGLGWSYAHDTNEYWTVNNAWFIMGALQVEKAMGKLSG